MSQADTAYFFSLNTQATRQTVTGPTHVTLALTGTHADRDRQRPQVGTHRPARLLGKGKSRKAFSSHLKVVFI